MSSPMLPKGLAGMPGDKRYLTYAAGSRGPRLSGSFLGPAPRRDGSQMEGRAQDPAMRQVMSGPVSPPGGRDSDSKDFSITRNPLQNYALPRTSASASTSGRDRERDSYPSHRPGQSGAHIYETSPSAFPATPSSSSKRSPKGNAQRASELVLAAIKDIMQGKTETGAHKGALEQRIAQTGITQFETDRLLQNLGSCIDALPARDRDVMQQGRQLAHALVQCDKESQAWRRRAVEAENAASKSAAAVAAAKQEAEHKIKVLEAEKEEAEAMIRAKTQDAVEAHHDARKLAMFCEDYMAKEKELMSSLEDAKAETKAALAEKQSVGEKIAQWTRDKQDLNHATFRESEMQTLLVEARAEAAKIRAQASAREATLLRALDEAHAENQLLKDASISAPREPYAGQRLFDESAAKRLIDTYGSRGGGDGGTAVGLLPLPADSPQAPVRGLRPGLLPLPPDSPLSGPHEHDGHLSQMWAGLNQAIRDVQVTSDSAATNGTSGEGAVVINERQVSKAGPTAVQAQPRTEQDSAEETPEVDMKVLQMQMAKKRANLQAMISSLRQEPDEQAQGGAPWISP